MEKKIEDALNDIMDIVYKYANAEGSGGEYDGNVNAEIKSILEYLIQDSTVNKDI